ncbi:MAG: hypothetical protein J7621_07845 [Niastella sp.]|nr:hypothetical protein [Niastella sp.]
MSSKLSITKESYCDPPLQVSGNNHRISYNIDSVLSVNGQLTQKFSTPSIIVMYAAGILHEGMRLVQLQNDTTNNLQVRQLSQHIQSKILLANAEIHAVAAELDCEGQRIDQLTQYVEAINAKQTARLTVTSIVIGAATGIAGSLVSNANWVKGIAIGGGISGAGISIATLNPKGKKIELAHKRNLLRNVWLQENNNDITPFLWLMLTEKRISNAGTRAILTNLKHRWIKYQFDGDEAAAATSVNFTNGGIYRADELRNRAAMINQLRVEILSLEQYIHILLQELQPGQ